VQTLWWIDENNCKRKIVHQRKKMKRVFAYMILSIVLGTMVHEGVHLLQLRSNNLKPIDACFFGFSKDHDNFLKSGIGWVEYEGMTDVTNELWPTIIGSAVIILEFFLLCMSEQINEMKEEKEREYEKYETNKKVSVM